jgi:hypothetical protein
VGRRKLGHDPFRHGRFTIIVEQRENSLYKTQNKGCFIKYTLFSANQYKIQWYSYLVALVIEVTRIKKAYKINDLGLDIIGRRIKFIMTLSTLGIIFFIICIGTGLLMLIKPEIMWEIRHFLSVKNGEPTDFYLFTTRMGGIILIIVGIVYLFFII